MLTSILIGFSLGLALSLFNHYLSVRSYNKLVPSPEKKSNKKFTNGFLLRQFFNLALLFLLRKDMWMLTAAAFGLTMVKNFILIQYTLGKKGVS